MNCLFCCCCCCCFCCCLSCCYYCCCWSHKPTIKVWFKSGQEQLRYWWHWVCVGGGVGGLKSFLCQTQLLSWVEVELGLCLWQLQTCSRTTNEHNSWTVRFHQRQVKTRSLAGPVDIFVRASCGNFELETDNFCALSENSVQMQDDRAFVFKLQGICWKCCTYSKKLFLWRRNEKNINRKKWW